MLAGAAPARGIQIRVSREVPLVAFQLFVVRVVEIFGFLFLAHGSLLMKKKPSSSLNITIGR
jgi:hypothetical protein